MSTRHEPAVFLVTGPPGAGKTSALTSLERQYPGFARFGVRDYGLRLAEAGDPLGLALRDTLVRNELLTNELVLKEFRCFLDRVPGTVRSVAVEGYPRDLAQCADLLGAVERRGLAVEAFIVVELPEEVSRARVVGRKVCTRCGAPATDGAKADCVQCGSPTKEREDDAADRLSRRLAEYRTCSAEVGAYFAERNLLRVVDGLDSRDQVRNALTELMVKDDEHGRART